jgi:hypothetical protein
MKTPEQLRAWRAGWRKMKETRIFYGSEMVGSPGTPVYEKVFPSMDALQRHREEERRLSERRAREWAEFDRRRTEAARALREVLERELDRSFWGRASRRILGR